MQCPVYICNFVNKKEMEGLTHSISWKNSAKIVSFRADGRKILFFGFSDVDFSPNVRIHCKLRPFTDVYNINEV